LGLFPGLGSASFGKYQYIQKFVDIGDGLCAEPQQLSFAIVGINLHLLAMSLQQNLLSKIVNPKQVANIPEQLH